MVSFVLHTTEMPDKFYNFNHVIIVLCSTYSFKKHERIITFFNNFSDFLCEEAMWQISESIKPRGGKKAQPQN